MNGVYLDAQASTPLAPEARDALLAHLANPANPHSSHAAGQRAHAAIEQARSTVAELIGAAPTEIYFTSGATEANNLAILGFARAAAQHAFRRTIITSAIEHPSVLEAAQALEAEGFIHRLAPVGLDGRLDLDAFERLLREGDTLLASIMVANNVTGIVQPVREAAVLARRHGALIHSDAAQAGCRLSLNVLDLDLDALSLSAHKMHGPQGVGALYLSAATSLRPRPITFGGGQENGLRSGTAPTGLIAAFGVAARLALDGRDHDAVHATALADRLLVGLHAHQVRFCTHGSAEQRVPGSLSIALEGCNAQDILERLHNKVFLSTGSACSSGRAIISPALAAMCLNREVARSTLRICFTRYSTELDADIAAAEIAGAVHHEMIATGSTVQ